MRIKLLHGPAAPQPFYVLKTIVKGKENIVIRHIFPMHNGNVELDSFGRIYLRIPDVTLPFYELTYGTHPFFTMDIHLIERGQQVIARRRLTDKEHEILDHNIATLISLKL